MGRIPLVILMLAAFAIPVATAVVLWRAENESSATRPADPHSVRPSAIVEATAEQVHETCGVCHAYPPPETFPKDAWRREVKQAYDFLRDSKLRLDFPSLESVALYYENRAPEQLALLEKAQTGPPRVRFEQVGYRLPENLSQPAISHVNLVHLFDKRKLDVLACDLRHNLVMALKPYDANPTWQILARLPSPAHAEVIDLDGDGIQDLIVANLGSFHPTNGKVGSVTWLRGTRDGKFVPYTLLEGVGRVADVQAADFNGEGKKDLVVGVFGWRNTGEIIYLQNKTTDWTKPNFVPHVVDDRHGTIHVPVCDLNGDGRPDFVALISQEHETIVAFLNEGSGRFRKETIYAAPHPAYGSSGIQIVDLNRDGKLDVLYTNGDVLDPPMILKPYHGIQWLENRGTFPFVHHALAPMYGVERAVAADMHGDGRLDIIAVNYLPAASFPQREHLNLPSIVLLEQTAPGKYVQRTLETSNCNYFSCAVGDVHGDGKAHLVTGNFFLSKNRPTSDAVAIWKNLGVTAPAPANAP